MNGKITFVGAGPGAPDLITVRGAEALKHAELVVYAGSLVNEKLLDYARNAELVNSAKLSLDEVLLLLCNGYRAGKSVVRLHTGDPAMYGAVSEQYRELDKQDIPYDVVPGVSSAFAALPRRSSARSSLQGQRSLVTIHRMRTTAPMRRRPGSGCSQRAWS